MYLLHRVNVLLDFICMGYVELPGARKKQTFQTEKYLPIVGLSFANQRWQPRLASSPLYPPSHISIVKNESP